MSYRIRIKKSASKALARIPPPDRLRLVQAIDRLALEPNAGGVLKGEFAGLRRLRVGRYRIIYEVYANELTLLGIRVAPRGAAYR